MHLPSEPRHKTINTNGSYLSSFKTERKAIKCTSNVYLTVIFKCMTFTNPGERQRSRGRGWKTQQAVWRGKWEGWKSSSTMPWLLKDWKPLVLHAQISCLCTLQVSASFFPPFLLLVWVYHPYPTVPCTLLPSFVIYDPTNPLSQFSLLFNFSRSPSPVLLSSRPTIGCHHASELSSFLLHPSMASPGTLCHQRHSWESLQFSLLMCSL